MFIVAKMRGRVGVRVLGGAINRIQVIYVCSNAFSMSLAKLQIKCVLVCVCVKRIAKISATVCNKVGEREGGGVVMCALN